MINLVKFLVEKGFEKTGWSLSALEMHKINKELIEKLMNVKEFSGERKRKEKRVKILKKELLLGESILFRWVLAYIKGNDSVLIRVNGQHSIYSMNEIWNEIEDIVKANSNYVASIEIYECENEKGLAKLFSKFDPSFSTRNIFENYSFEKVAVTEECPEMANVKDSEFRAVIGGINYSKGIKYSDTTAFERAKEAIEGNEEFCLFANSILTNTIRFSGKSLLHNNGVVRVMYEIYNLDKEAAMSFFGNLVKRKNYDLDSSTLKSPIVLLEKKLIEVVIDKSEGKMLMNGTKSNPVLQAASYTLCAFNHWQNGRYLERLSIPKEVSEKDGNYKGTYVKLPFEPIVSIDPVKRENRRIRNYKAAYKQAFEHENHEGFAAK
jgi:nucleoside diphosphate kinase